MHLALLYIEYNIRCFLQSIYQIVLHNNLIADTLNFQFYLYQHRHATNIDNESLIVYLYYNRLHFAKIIFLRIVNRYLQNIRSFNTKLPLMTVRIIYAFIGVASKFFVFRVSARVLTTLLFHREASIYSDTRAISHRGYTIYFKNYLQHNLYRSMLTRLIPRSINKRVNEKK